MKWLWDDEDASGIDWMSEPEPERDVKAVRLIRMAIGASLKHFWGFYPLLIVPFVLKAISELLTIKVISSADIAFFLASVLISTVFLFLLLYKIWFYTEGEKFNWLSGIPILLRTHPRHVLAATLLALVPYSFDLLTEALRPPLLLFAIYLVLSLFILLTQIFFAMYVVLELEDMREALQLAAEFAYDSLLKFLYVFAILIGIVLVIVFMVGPPDLILHMLSGSLIIGNLLILATLFFLVLPFFVFVLFNLFLIYFKYLEEDDEFLDIWLGNVEPYRQTG